MSNNLNFCTMYSNSQLSKISEMLPSISGKGINYDSSRNLFYTDGWTSCAGNTYYKGLRLSDRLIITTDLGQGYAYLFLNGLHIYGYNGKDKRLVASKYYNCCVYSDSFVKTESEKLVRDFLIGQLRLSYSSVDESMVSNLSHQLVESTYCDKQIC